MDAHVHPVGGLGQNCTALHSPQMAQLQAQVGTVCRKEKKKEGEKHDTADCKFLFFCKEQQNCKHSVSRAEEKEIWLKKKNINQRKSISICQMSEQDYWHLATDIFCETQ